MIRHTIPCGLHIAIGMANRYTQGSFFDRSFWEV